MKIFRFRAVALIAFAFSFLMGNGALVVNTAPAQNFTDNQSHRFFSLFCKRSIEANGWDWFVENFIINKNSIIPFIIQDGKRKSILISSKNQRNLQYYEAIRKTFDMMAERNDTICYPFPYDCNKTKWKEVREYRSSLISKQISDEFFAALRSATSIFSESYWIGEYPFFDAKCVCYGLVSGLSFITKEAKEGYLQECSQLGITPWFEYNKEDLSKISSDELSVIRKFLEMDIDAVLSLSFPNGSFDTGVSYEKLNESDSIHCSWIRPIKSEL